MASQTKQVNHILTCLIFQVSWTCLQSLVIVRSALPPHFFLELCPVLQGLEDGLFYRDGVQLPQRLLD